MRSFPLLPDPPEIDPVWESRVIQYRPAKDARLVAAMRVLGLIAILTFDRTGFSLLRRHDIPFAHWRMRPIDIAERSQFGAGSGSARIGLRGLNRWSCAVGEDGPWVSADLRNEANRGVFWLSMSRQGGLLSLSESIIAGESKRNAGSS
jgi:hypothetical protein